MRFYETLTLQKWEKIAVIDLLFLYILNSRMDGRKECLLPLILDFSEILALCEIMTPLLLQIGGTRDTISATADGLHFEKNDQCVSIVN